MKKGLNKPLRKGYTTGACAAAAAKAATLIVIRYALSVMSCDSKNGKISITDHASRITDVEIPFPNGSRVKFRIHASKLATRNSQLLARASVIKDAGDDPDITNGAEIAAEAVFSTETEKRRNGETENFFTSFSPIPRFPDSPIHIIIKGGKGVGVVTKPGLAVPVGCPAINPVPMRMIREAVEEVLSSEFGVRSFYHSKTQNSELKTLEITISVPKGKELAKKTLNSRLGIIGGISILGTTGIVESMSVDAYKETISLGIDMAIAAGLSEIVFTPGRNSEKYAEEILRLKEEAFVQMGDYAGFAFKTAVKKGIKKIDVVGQLGKMAKIADGNFKTHVRDSNLNLSNISKWAEEWGYDKTICKEIKQSNTARQVSDSFENMSDKRFFELVGKRVIEKIRGLLKKDIEIRCIILSSNGAVMADVKQEVFR
ncbi:MAG: cobalamin biosynthesis protein CbiD [Nitrospirae bacterium]|nr:cobalamin biosynthesis protein CbiD [Nitrospirota bacterium]